MFCKCIIPLICLVVAVIPQGTTSVSLHPSNKLITPIDVAKYQIETLIKLVDTIVTRELKSLHNIREVVRNTVQNAIDIAIAEIDGLFNSTIGQARKIMEDALDKGINITECYVLNVDKVHNMRRQFIIEEIVCATSQAGAFYAIADHAMSNFTDDVIRVAEYPKRLQKCLMNPLTAIKCVSALAADVSQLQKEIPMQVFATMLEVSDFLTGFERRLHQCQFDTLRKAVTGFRPIIDNIIGCAQDPEHHH